MPTNRCSAAAPLQQRLLVLGCLALSLLHGVTGEAKGKGLPSTSLAATPSASSSVIITAAGRTPAEQRSAAAACSSFKETYAQIDLDLALWAKTGITQEDMKRTIRHNTTTLNAKGIALGFEAGRAYVVEKPRALHLVGHHASLFHTYMRTMLDLERRFGAALPDVEFVVQTMDRPVDVLWEHSGNGSHNPIMRFCKSAAHADILVPMFHFHTKRYDSQLLAAIPRVNARYPWANRTSKAFTRYSVYDRHLHPDDTNLWRKGFEGSRICRRNGKRVMACRVRNHFQVWAKRHPGELDVSSHQHRAMESFAEFKYLIQLDGQGLSSKMEQLITLGSAVMREESGYYGHYYHLLQPYKHYIPFWKDTPEEILKAVQWAREHDAEAQAIGRAGQDFALRYLNADARACYWLTLLQRYAKLLRYTPGRANRHYAFYEPVDVYLRDVASQMALDKKAVFEP